MQTTVMKEIIWKKASLKSVPKNSVFFGRSYELPGLTPTCFTGRSKGPVGAMTPKRPTIFLFCKKTDFMTNFLTPQIVTMQKGVQLQGASSPYPLTRVFTPGPRWGLCHQTTVIGSRFALTMCPSKPWSWICQCLFDFRLTKIAYTLCLLLF